ncbi:MAG: DEAD/DEAH box helicase family protein, partial [Burkholderiales bacterium]|nr:DEAD/DEAH box helicase family protein [Burkholderiales bacterium]
KKQLRPHQKNALLAVQNGFKTHSRGKLIMACGTGKTFTALKIAENVAGCKKSVLFLVPSLALMSQTITDWCIESDLQLHAFAVCSDSQVGKRKQSDEDISDIDIHDLIYPATTDAKKLALSVIKYINQNGMLVVFATYQSIEVVSKAQLEFNMPEFDLIICDEAHRTTGARLNAVDESDFVKIHNNDFIMGKKRLYMTATPRVYIEAVKNKASDANVTLYSMDDTIHYGEVFYSLKFGEAVESGLLSDYKVLVLALDEEQVARDIQHRLSEHDELKLDDVSKIIGCYKALIKSGVSFSDNKPMQKAVAFCNSIKNSKLFVQEFKSVVEEYLQANGDLKHLNCELDHVDGKMNALEKTKKLNWLKEITYDTCRILSNARCLSEGVDVPSLDAVMFIHARKSKVDIVQSVGRVMRKSPGKNMGYVILPIGIPAGVNPEDALKDHASYSIVYDVLNALRSHDERLDSKINQANYDESIADKIEIISYVNKLPEFKSEKEALGVGGSNGNNPADDEIELRDGKIKQSVQNTLDGLEFDSIQQAIMAKIVEHCGTRTYWEDWANDIAEIARKHILRIKLVLDNQDSQAYQIFIQFVNQLRDNLNESITNDEVIEMLAQHIITKPVFNALFSDYNFTEHNSISKSMQSILDILDGHNIDNEAHKLEQFYQSIKRRADGIATADAKQKIIVELYDKFFRNAFPRMTERLGIVYTPVECVDFIIHSVNDILKQEFNQELGDKNTHIIDPFTGTGTFITRLMQSGLLSKEQLEYKYNLREKQLGGEKIYTTEIHANELILLAYYIASINIESVYHAIVGGAYKPFEGICLTDTFQLSERDEDLITPQLADNNHRRKIQKKVPIRVFIGNPPYSAGQNSGNDNNQNLKYTKLDGSISNSYEKYATATLKNSLYDSYIRAIRWASDRIDKYGVIGFITNAGWIASNSADGMRKCLKDEFSSIYIFHLRGGIRGLNGDRAKKEGQNVFDIMTAVAITLFIKNPQATKQGKIYFYDIGDYLTRDEKLKKISSLRSINNITLQGLWQEITPDKYNDWLNQRDDGFYNYIPLGDKKNKSDIHHCKAEVSSSLRGEAVAIFENYSNGLKTNRDAWVYNYSKAKLTQNVSDMIDFYNSELERYKKSDAIKNQPKKLSDAEKYVANFVNNDNRKIAWTVNIRAMLSKLVVANIEPDNFVCALYRPFTKGMCYFNKDWNERTLQLPKIFPEVGVDNLVIGVTSL